MVLTAGSQEHLQKNYTFRDPRNHTVIVILIWSARGVFCAAWRAPRDPVSAGCLGEPVTREVVSRSPPHGPRYGRWSGDLRPGAAHQCRCRRLRPPEAALFRRSCPTATASRIARHATALRGAGKEGMGPRLTILVWCGGQGRTVGEIVPKYLRPMQVGEKLLLALRRGKA